ncbi:MAG: LysR family transcriptional regulator [Burkholderiales bacterium]|nr:LysR family transcriptional regulator [Burkholderiales bacterium]
MDHLQCLRTFVAVAEAGSFVRGAQQREVSAAAATRAIAALEKRLGAVLLHRTTRSLRLTEQGEAFLADCRRIVAELDAAEAAITGARSQPSGLLSVTAPALFGSRHVAPLLIEFLGHHPLVQARAFFTNRVVHLIDEGFDVALRISHLPDSGLTALPLGAMRAVVVASPAYLKRHGVPRTPADLARHQGIGFTIEDQGRSSWRLGRARTATAPQERLVVNANDVKVAAAVAGEGLARALAYQVTDEVQDGRLRVVLQEHEGPPVPVHLVYPAGRAAAAKVRAFVQFAAERLQALPVLQGGGLEGPRAKSKGRGQE